MRKTQTSNHRRVAPAGQRAVLTAADVLRRELNWRDVLGKHEWSLQSADSHVAIVQLNIFRVNQAIVDEMTWTLFFLSQVSRAGQHGHSAYVEAVDTMSRRHNVVLVQHWASAEMRPEDEEESQICYARFSTVER